MGYAHVLRGTFEKVMRGRNLMPRAFVGGMLDFRALEV